MADMCHECWKRFEKKENFEQIQNICVYCMGLLADAEVESVAKSIEELMKSERLDAENYNLGVSLPMSLLLREKLAEFQLKSVPLNGIRDAWRQAVVNKLALPFNAKSDFTVTVTFSYSKDDTESKEMAKILGGDSSAVKSRNSLIAFLNSVDFSKISPDIKISFFSQSNSELTWTLSWARDPLIIGGRYRKYSRYLCQTPWMVDGKLKSKTSIEELIINPMKRTHSSQSYEMSQEVAAAAAGPSFEVFVFGSNMVLSPDMLEDWLFILSAVNAQRMNEAQEADDMGYFFAFKAVDFIFRAADRAKVSREAKYMAMALFNQFIMRHILSLYQYVVESNSKSVRQDWEKVEAKVSNQLPLRAATCIQICAKITGTPTLAGLTIQHVRRMLQEWGHCYVPEAILHSELRVLKTIDFSVDLANPLTYMELLWKLIEPMDVVTKVDVLDWFSTSLDILDFACLRKCALYSRLFELTRLEALTDDERQRFMVVQADYMLLAGGVLCATAYVISDAEFAVEIATAISDIVKYKQEDLIDFAAAIIHELIYCGQKHDASKQRKVG